MLPCCQIRTWTPWEFFIGLTQDNYYQFINFVLLLSAPFIGFTQDSYYQITIIPLLLPASTPDALIYLDGISASILDVAKL